VLLAGGGSGACGLRFSALLVGGWWAVACKMGFSPGFIFVATRYLHDPPLSLSSTSAPRVSCFLFPSFFVLAGAAASENSAVGAFRSLARDLAQGSWLALGLVQALMVQELLLRVELD